MYRNQKQNNNSALDITVKSGTMTKKFFAVEVFDNTCNVMGHESGIYGKGDYSWITDTLNGCDGAEYNMTEAEALEVKSDFEQKIKEYNLDWASVKIDSIEVDVDDEE